MTRGYVSRLFIFAVPYLAICALLGGCRSGQVDEGCYWGPIPNREKLQLLKAKGVRTIVMVRLNPMHKEEEMVRNLGLNYVHIPTGLFRTPQESGIEEFLQIASDPALRPIYICDQLARDRTQFYAGIYGMVSQRWSAKRASWQMYRNGLRHWWPWFYKYKDIIQRDEPEIRRAAARLQELSKRLTQLPAKTNRAYGQHQDSGKAQNSQLRPQKLDPGALQQ